MHAYVFDMPKHQVHFSEIASSERAQMNLQTDNAVHAALCLSNNEALALVIVARRWRRYNGLLRNQRPFFFFFFWG